MQIFIHSLFIIWFSETALVKVLKELALMLTIQPLKENVFQFIHTKEEIISVFFWKENTM